MVRKPDEPNWLGFPVGNKDPGKRGRGMNRNYKVNKKGNPKKGCALFLVFVVGGTIALAGGFIFAVWYRV